MPDKPANLCFLDSNVWLYAFVEGSEPEKSVIARRLITDFSTGGQYASHQ